MNLKQLEYFVSVADLGSFSKAARALDIAQPALSRQVRALETDLHESLLLRNGGGHRKRGARAASLPPLPARKAKPQSLR